MSLNEAAVACREARAAGCDDVPGGGLLVFPPSNIAIPAGLPPETLRHQQHRNKPFDILDTRAIGRPAGFIVLGRNMAGGRPDRAAEHAATEARTHLPALAPVDRFGPPASLGIRIRAMPAASEGLSRARSRGAGAPAAGVVRQAVAAAGATS